MREIPFHFPRELSAYVMANADALPNAQLVHRRIDYRETAEYRVLEPGGTTSTRTVTSGGIFGSRNVRRTPAVYMDGDSGKENEKASSS